MRRKGYEMEKDSYRLYEVDRDVRKNEKHSKEQGDYGSRFYIRSGET